MQFVWYFAFYSAQLGFVLLLFPWVPWPCVNVCMTCLAKEASCMWFCWNRKTIHVLEFSEVTIVPFSLFHAAAVAVCVRWWGGNPCMLVLWLLLAFRITFILCVCFSGSVLQWPFSVLLTSIECIAEDAISNCRWILSSFDWTLKLDPNLDFSWEQLSLYLWICVSGTSDSQ